MNIEHLKLKRNEPFARNHGDSLDVSQQFRMIADERSFVWLFDDKTGKQWLIPFAGIRAWQRSASDDVPLAVSEQVPLALKQVRVGEEAMMEHNLDGQAILAREGFDICLSAGVVYITDKVRKHELGVTLEQCEYMEVYPDQQHQLKPMQDAVRPLKRPVGRPRKEANAAQ